MSLNYNSYISQIANLAVISSADANFQTMVPGMIDYAEQRIYRELDPLRVQVTDTTAALSSGNRNLTVPSATHHNFSITLTINRASKRTNRTILSKPHFPSEISSFHIIGKEISYFINRESHRHG